MPRAALLPTRTPWGKRSAKHSCGRAVRAGQRRTDGGGPGGGGSHACRFVSGYFSRWGSSGSSDGGRLATPSLSRLQQGVAAVLPMREKGWRAAWPPTHDSARRPPRPPRWSKMRRRSTITFVTATSWCCTPSRSPSFTLPPAASLAGRFAGDGSTQWYQRRHAGEHERDARTLEGRCEEESTAVTRLG